jgi:hypothetical protein
MAKRPKDSPNHEGQRVILRGRGIVGTIDKLDEGGWCWVRWLDPNAKAAKICHVNELALQNS